MPGWTAATSPCPLTRWPDFRRECTAWLRTLRERDGRFLVAASRISNECIRLVSYDGGCVAAEVAVVEPPGSTGSGEWHEWAAPVRPPEIVRFVVETLRGRLKVASPEDLEIARGSMEATTAILTVAASRYTRDWQDSVLWLPPGEVVDNPLGRARYEVGELLGKGGFGAAYGIVQVAGEPLPGPLCLKVSLVAETWHREAYFGQLLRGAERAIQVHDSFAWPRQGAPVPLYCLVTELAGEGALTQYLAQNPDPWPEAKARREMIALLRTMKLLHASGAVHRDITPNNVFVAPGPTLKLGDFGIAVHRVGNRAVPADVFAKWFAPPKIYAQRDVSWRAADDVFHLGQIYAALLCGCADAKLSGPDVKKIPCSTEAKIVIQRSIGERRKRFAGAAEMLAALERHDEQARRRVRLTSLAGKRVVFTGELSVPRKEAIRLARKAGADVGQAVNGRTDVLVVGFSPHWKAGSEGQKLLDADRERERGHEIAALDEKRFLRLCGARG